MCRGEPIDNGAWSVRRYHKPLSMALGRMPRLLWLASRRCDRSTGCLQRNRLGCLDQMHATVSEPFYPV